jgi:hypothetical protein
LRKNILGALADQAEINGLLDFDMPQRRWRESVLELPLDTAPSSSIPHILKPRHQIFPKMKDP